MRPGARSAALANSLVPLGKNPSEGVCRDVLLWLQAAPDAIGLNQSQGEMRRRMG